MLFTKCPGRRRSRHSKHANHRARPPLACAGGFLVWLFRAKSGGLRPLNPEEIVSWTFASFALGKPLLEEILFRGFLQGELLRQNWFARRSLGLTRANLIVSVLFAAAHWARNPSPASLLVFVPSLAFGYFRDRDGNIWSAWLLHSFYNAGFLLLFTGEASPA